MTRIADPQTLALHEALMIDGGWDRYSDQELARQLPPTVRPARLKDQLANGELVLLRDTPSIPLFQVVAGRVVRSESPSGAINPLAADALGIRFGDRDFAARAPGYGQSDSLPPPPALTYTPEPPVPEPPPNTFPPVAVISENFALPPLGPKVFAKSCTRPNGDTDSNEGEEKASNFGALALFATANTSGASALRPLDLVAGSSMRLTEGWAMAMRLGASVLTSAAGVALLALWPAKLGDGTLYTEEELRAISEAAIRVRFHLHMDESGKLRVSGYHANHETGHGDTVRVVQARRIGEHFEAVVDNDVTLVWYPDDSGYRPVATTEYPADSGVNPHRILVTPIREEGQEAITPGNYERPFEDQIERIVSFPADSGIEPLYLVFRKTARDERGVVTGNGEEITGIWLESASRDLGAPIPAKIADRLRGREFASFDRFREAFWLEVARDQELMGHFGSRNQKAIRAGRAPFTRLNDQAGKRNRYEIHHVLEIRNGGLVYDVENLRVVTPSNHIEMHRRK
ncbi:S-type pyocin domain-containing protein [Marinobacter sp. C2H3]|uniref:S-type pyocin domain-containing protein n=1 Tax=Marinobacter sp. C2H3 TaxID=3119003 RepID=UPI00300EB477